LIVRITAFERRIARGTTQVAGHQRHRRDRDRRIGAGAHGNTDIACASAGASLTPSPTTADGGQRTVDRRRWSAVCGLQFLHRLRVVARQHCGDHLIDPDQAQRGGEAGGEGGCGSVTTRNHLATPSPSPGHSPAVS